VKIKINNTIYDSEKEPVMLILSAKDKENINNMHPEAMHFCSYPEGMNLDAILRWMKTEPFKPVIIKECNWCKKKFKIDDYDPEIWDTEDDRFMCNDCAKIHGVPEGWLYVGNEWEIKEVEDSEALTPLQEQMDRITEYINENLDDKIVLYDKVYSIYCDCSQRNWDGYDAAPIEKEAYRNAINLIKLLPGEVIIPDVIAENTGDISLCWERNDETLIVSVGKEKKIQYVRVAERYHLSGDFDFEEEIPLRILNEIKDMGFQYSLVITSL
jgi:hypothetical protein